MFSYVSNVCMLFGYILTCEYVKDRKSINVYNTHRPLTCTLISRNLNQEHPVKHLRALRIQLITSHNTYTHEHVLHVWIVEIPGNTFLGQKALSKDHPSSLSKKQDILKRMNWNSSNRIANLQKKLCLVDLGESLKMRLQSLKSASPPRTDCPEFEVRPGKQ